MEVSSQLKILKVERKKNFDWAYNNSGNRRYNSPFILMGLTEMLRPCYMSVLYISN